MNTGEPSKKEEPHCLYCDGTDVIRDASAEWNKSTQQWEVRSTYDNGYCHDCETETKYFNWK